METLIAILMYLGVFASAEKLNDVEFQQQNQDIIHKASIIKQANSFTFHLSEGGGVIIDEVSI